MSLYAIADLHLSTNASTNKSMEKFGSRWLGYVNKLEKNWRAVVNDDDTVVIPGDISWAMTIDEALSDFRFLDALPGKKILGKGNHDFWWSTAAKIGRFFEENGIRSIDLLYNNAYRLDDCVIAGSRGWFADEKQQNAVGDPDFATVVRREAGRLERSLEAACALRGSSSLPILVFLHFPPVNGECVIPEILEVLHRYEIRDCFYGHLHGNYALPRCITYEGIDFAMIAADHLNFAPMPIFL